jgi:DNA-binding PadR family transcriptional regulator
MGERTFLSEFEHLTLAAALHLRHDAYGAALMREIEERTGRKVQAGTVYLTVQRLEDKGLVSCTLGEPDESRGGRPKRYVTPTAAGVRALAEHREALLGLWDGLEAQLEKIR